MVRLESLVKHSKRLVWQVSIPKWCDWSLSRKFVRDVTYQFQFLNGAIGVHLYLENTDNVNTVSIPKWCDWSADNALV